VSGGPLVELAAESGADTGDALVYGGAIVAARRINPDLTLGLGAIVKHEIEQTRARPILIVSWRINDSLRLENSAPHGPADLTGLELVYQRTERWQIAAGGSVAHSRFRLDKDGRSGGGVSDTRAMPIFARATRSLGELGALSIYVGALLEGRLRLEDASGALLAEDEYGSAPFVALSFRSSL
jgi:Domain of unknown function (DUF6268)